MIFQIVHRTLYTYADAVARCHNEARVLPRVTGMQRCLESWLDVRPAPATVYERLDYFGNRVAYFALHDPHSVLEVIATSTVELLLGSARAAQPSPAWEALKQQLAAGGDEETLAAREFVLDSPGVRVTADLAAYAALSFAPGRPALEAVADLTRRIHTDFLFKPGQTTVATPVQEVLERRHGVCQDFAHLAIGCLRAMGLAARYVSGYLETVPPPGEPRLQGADVSHAWFAVFVAELGWIDFDPTNDQIPWDQHVTTAWGRDYGDVAPLKGVIFGGGSHTLKVSVDMQRGAPPAR